MTDYEKRVSRLGMFILAVGLLIYGLFGLYRESGPKVTDPHAIITGVALILLVPSQIASGIRVAGGALMEVYQAWKASGTVPPPTPPSVKP